MGNQVKAYVTGYDAGSKVEGTQRELDGSGPRPKVRPGNDIDAYSQGRWDAAHAAEGQRATQRMGEVNEKDTKPSEPNATKHVGK
jgi:hypothetical protein